MNAAAYLTKLPDGDRFVWSIYVNDHVPEVPGVPITGWAGTLDRATAACKRSYGRMREKAGLPKPQPSACPSVEPSDRRICLASVRQRHDLFWARQLHGFDAQRRTSNE